MKLLPQNREAKEKNMNPHTTTVIHVDYNLLYVGILLLLFHFFFFFAFLYYFVIFVFLHAHIGAQYIYIECSYCDSTFSGED